MRYRIITDKEYLTVPMDNLQNIQAVLDSTAILIMALSRITIEDKFINDQIAEVISKFNNLNDAPPKSSKVDHHPV
jgi:hypothetical protein